VDNYKVNHSVTHIYICGKCVKGGNQIYIKQER